MENLQALKAGGLGVDPIQVSHLHDFFLLGLKKLGSRQWKCEDNLSCLTNKVKQQLKQQILMQFVDWLAECDYYVINNIYF